MRQARSLMSHLNLLTLRMLAQADQLEAASRKLMNCQLKFQAATDQLTAAAETMQGHQIDSILGKDIKGFDG